MTTSGRPSYPIDFGAPDARPVSESFAILVPSEANDAHLELLARVAEMLSDGGLRKRLAAAATVAEAHDRMFPTVHYGPDIGRPGHS